jgi:hypothetical protein
MPIINVLYLVNGKEKVEVLRWMEFRPNATFDTSAGVVSWPSGLSGQSGSLRYGEGKVVSGLEFNSGVVGLVKKLGLGPFGLKREGAQRSLWACIGANAEDIARALVTLRWKYLVLNPGTLLPDIAVESCIVVPGVDVGPPMCLRDEYVEEKPVLTKRDSRHPTGLASLPCPGYWPVVRVFVPSGLPELAIAIQSALSQSTLKGFTTPSADLVVLASTATDSTFLRDYWINIYHRNQVLQDTESRSTTKGDGGGFSDNQQVINRVHTTDLGEASGSGFGFGGNFLTCQVDTEIYLFHGGCSHQFGVYKDDRFMVEKLRFSCRETVNFVAIDTGWLKVGHVDEIFSFPRPKVALLASPLLYSKLCGSHALADVDLNTRIEAKLKVIATALESISIECIRLPVWFAPVETDPMHVTSVRGNAVNCIYIGRFAIHSQSGPKGDAGPNGASGPIDLYVAEVMAKLDYTSIFVDLRAANDEGGAGGNVHCATYTIHLPK